MAGGLALVAIYGSQDIFLTGTPTITYFKVVYRRHTNFALESIPQHFLGDVNFGSETSAVIEKVGDLMSRVYLEIEIPKVNLLKNTSQWELTQQEAQKQFHHIQEYYQLVLAYVSANTDIIRKLLLLLKTNNIPISDIRATMSDPQFIGILNNLRQELQNYIATNPNFDQILELRGKKTDLIQQINQIDISKNFNAYQERQNILRRIPLVYQGMRSFYLQAYQIYVTKERIHQLFLDGTYVERYRFAWVEELGHAIIDELDMMIGSEVIDRHTGDWFILFNKLFLRESQIQNYHRMIGNIPKLTIFDDQVKNSYKLVIPFQFWFCRHTGLALPLIALRYHDVIFNLKLKKLSDLCYVQQDPKLINMSTIQSQYNLNLGGVKLYVDYIFLDREERKRFAQSTHEYLIETVQYAEFDQMMGRQDRVHLTFSHPTKFIVWFVQPNQYRSNPTGQNKCQWNNFGTNSDKTGYTMSEAILQVNTYHRMDPPSDIKYYNYVQPYWYFRRSPTDGVYVYSFGIMPMEHQPSGSLDLSRIDDFSIRFTLTDNFLELVHANQAEGVQTGVYFGAYAMSYNILRIAGGMGSLAFAHSF